MPVQESLSHHLKQFWNVLFSAIRPDSCGVCALFALVLLFHSLSGHLERNWGNLHGKQLGHTVMGLQFVS
jgi:hypothetical protein